MEAQGGVIQLKGCVVLVGISFLGIYWIPANFGKVFAAILAGLFTCRLFVIYPDFYREAILRRSLLTRIIMTGIGLLTLAPPSIRIESHHHRDDNNSTFSRMVIGSFPTITTTTFRNSMPTKAYSLLLVPANEFIKNNNPPQQKPVCFVNIPKQKSKLRILKLCLT